MEITIKTLASPSRKGDENEKERKKTRMAIAKPFSLHPNVKTKAIAKHFPLHTNAISNS